MHELPTASEHELLSLLAEECAEVIQIVAKIQRHGLESYHPHDPYQRPNRVLLERELGDVQAAIQLLGKVGLVNRPHLPLRAHNKLCRLADYLHSPFNLTALGACCTHLGSGLPGCPECEVIEKAEDAAL